jgi:hypothetical protein
MMRVSLFIVIPFMQCFAVPFAMENPISTTSDVELAYIAERQNDPRQLTVRLTVSGVSIRLRRISAKRWPPHPEQAGSVRAAVSARQGELDAAYRSSRR